MMQIEKFYKNRPSEYFVLEGYRHWSAGVVTGDYSYWEIVRDLFEFKLGDSDGQLVLGAVTRFAKAMGLFSVCPLQSSHVGCHSMCRDEVLMLGLVSGIQHEDETAIALCLDALVQPQRFEEVVCAATVLSSTLSSLEKHLLPVPTRTIRAILTGSLSTNTLH